MEIADLLGKTLVQISKGRDEVVFETSTGEKYKMYHQQDCCEDVALEDVNGDLNDLLGSPILLAEENSNRENGNHESCTWTFYKLATVNGHVVLRWYGESNGYYSETVDFERID